MPQVVIKQVKQKLGGLRVYVEGGNEHTQTMIDFAEVLSFRTCERCGRPGVSRDQKRWRTTLCDVCADASSSVD